MFPSTAQTYLCGHQGTSVPTTWLSERPISKLRAWYQEWQRHPPEQPRPWSARQLNGWKQRGYRLAAQVQAELTDTEVLVYDAHGEQVPLRRVRGQG
jgi:hypothetical protein